MQQPSPEEQPSPEQRSPGASRRQVVVMGAFVTLSGGAALSACSSGSATTPVAAPATSSTPPDGASPSATDSASVTTEATSSSARPAATTSSRGAAATTTSRTQAATTSAPATTRATAATKTTAPKTTTTKTTTKPPAEDFSQGALAKLSDIPVGGSIEVGGTVIARTGSNSVRGHSAICTHMGCTVGAGGRTLTCPCHGSQFDAASGSVLQGPATRPLPSVGLVVKGGYVHRG